MKAFGLLPLTSPLACNVNDDDDDNHFNTLAIVNAPIILVATASDGSKGILLYSSPYLTMIANNIDLIKRFNQNIVSSLALVEVVIMLEVVDMVVVREDSLLSISACWLDVNLDWNNDSWSVTCCCCCCS